MEAFLLPKVSTHDWHAAIADLPSFADAETEVVKFAKVACSFHLLAQLQDLQQMSSEGSKQCKRSQTAKKPKPPPPPSRGRQPAAIKT